MKLSKSEPDSSATDPRLRRVAELLREIEEEAVRMVEGRRGASPLAILSRAASARRHLDLLLEREPEPDSAALEVANAFQRRIRTAIHDLGLSVTAAANLTGTTSEEMSELLRGSISALPLDQLERVARRLETEQQLPLV